MQQNFCDICGIIIKPGEYKFMLYQQDLLVNPKKSANQEEFIKRYTRSSEEVVVKEICSECRKIYNYFFSLRIDKINKIKKEIEKSFVDSKEKVEYCECDEFEDSGMLEQGEENGICYQCGKLQKPLSLGELGELLEKGEFGI